MSFAIKIHDLFYGFVHSYWTFGIRDKSKHASWTHRILGYFASLGELLGFVIDYEWRKYDLVWFYDIPEFRSDEPWLHIEHENSARRLSNLLGKVKESVAPSVVAIGYPASGDAHKAFVKKIETYRKKADKEFMFILDPAYETMKEEKEIVAYISRPRFKSLWSLTAKRYRAHDGTYFASWMDREEDEGKE